MKIAIVATHSFPIPYKNIHTGDVCILDLAKSLKLLGHDITMIAPQGTDFPKIICMRASYGKYPPSSDMCEEEVFENYAERLQQFDMIHDFSNTKRITQSLKYLGNWKTCQTLLGGAWLDKVEPRNLCVWSESHRNRVLRGATDFEETSTPKLAGDDGYPVKEAHIVNGGIDTGFYAPNNYNKEDYYLWMGRWHQARGYKFAIELAKRTGIKLILAGDHPDNLIFDAEKICAKEAEEMCKGWSNIKLEYLPSDPDHHSAKRELLRGAVAFLYSVDLQEPFGLSQVEALSCGTPVIGNNLGSIPEVVVNGKTGIIVKLNDIDAWEKALTQVRELDPKICRRNAVKRFDKFVMAKNYLAQYDKIQKRESW